MTTTQKIIKYFAIAFAIVLIIGIVSAIVSAVSGLTLFIGNKDVVGDMITYSVSEPIDELAIDLSGAKLQIKEGSGFSVESNHKKLEINQSNGVLSIKEKKRFGIFNFDNVSVILTVPEGFTFDRANVSTDAGAVEIDSLNADKLSLSFGAGSVDIDKLVATASSRIDCGAGKLTVSGGELNNLDFDMGVGKVELTSKLGGSSDIDCGVGKMDLTLIGAKDDYRISLDKGIGSAVIDSTSVSNSTVYGFGSNSIDIDGGVGGIDIRFDSRN